jgi:DNA-binding transcriptional LysR family regulator
MDPLDRLIRTTNLNLLPVLRAVLKHRNLTRAAEELGVTQAAVSNSLRQLRDHFGDELLVRDGRRLCLTEKGRQLVEPLDRALVSIGRVLANAPFDPATSTHSFRIATADYVAGIVAPALAAAMEAEAPAIAVQLLTAHARSAHDLRTGEIDMVISPSQIFAGLFQERPAMAREITVEPLANEPFVCLGRKGDKAFARGLTVDQYLARPHASFHLDLEAHASLEHRYLAENALAQFNRIRTSDFMVLPLIAARSNCIVLVPRSVARLAARTLSLRMATPPLPFPDLELVMVWLNRREHEPQLTWLRGVLTRFVAASLA